MNEPLEQPTVGRILVALDASMRNLSVLEAAVTLAVHTRAELVALLVEDINLINLAGLPFIREVDGISAAAREYNGPRLARILRSQAEQVRNLLYRTTTERSLRASLRVVRGHFMVEALAAAAAMDVLFLGKAGGTIVPGASSADVDASHRRGHRAPPVPSARAPVWVLYDGSAAAGRALKLARDLNQVSAGRLNILLPAEDAETMSRWRGVVEATLGGQVTEVSMIALRAIDAISIRQALGAARCSLLLLPRNRLPSQAATALRFLDHVQGPVVLVP